MLRFLKVQLEAITDGFNNSLRTAQKEAKEFERTIKPTKQLLKDLGSEATAAGKTLTVAFTAPIAAIAGLGVQFNAMQEQAHIAFTTMLGDGKRAKAFLDDLKDFAARTPFDFPGLVQAAQRLMAMGFEADKVKPLLEAVGNAVAGLGKGSAEIDRITLALGQMQGRGRVATQEMNQLTEVGIRAWDALAKGFGVSEQKLRDLVEKGLVPADKAIVILTENMNTRFSGMLEKQAKSFSGLVSTIKDESRFLAGELTEGLFNALKGPAETITARLHDLRMSMAGWSDSTKATIVTVAGLAAATGPLLIGFGAVANSILSLQRVMGTLRTGFAALNLAMAGMFIGPAGLAVAGTVIIAGLVAAFIRYKQETSEVTQRLRIMQKAVDDTVSSSKKLADIGDEVAKSNGRLRIDTDALRIMMENARKEEEQLALSHRATGETLKGLTVDLKAGTVSMDGAAKSTSKYTLELDSASDKASKARKALEQWNDALDAQERMFESTLETIAATKKAREDLADAEFDRIKKEQEANRAHRTQMINIWQDMAAERERLEREGLSEFEKIQKSRRENEERNIRIIRDAQESAADDAKKRQEQAIEDNKRALERATQDIKRASGSVFDAMFLKSENVFKSLGNALKGGALSLGRAIFEDVTAALLGPVKKAFDDFIGGILGNISKKLGGVFGDLIGVGTSVAGTATQAAGGVAGAAGGVAGSVGGAAGGVGGATGGLASGLIGAAGGILGGVISGLMGARQEGTLNAVEFNTRASEIHLRSMIDQILWPIRGDVLAIRESAHLSTTQLDAIFNAIAGGGTTSSRVTSASMTSGGVAAPTATVSLVQNFAPVIHVDGLPEDWQTIFRERISPELMEAFRLNFRGSLDEMIRLLRSSGFVPATA